MIFHHPSVWLLLLLLTLPLLGWRMRRTRSALPHSTTAFLTAARGGLASWRWIVPAMRFAAMALLIVSVARPQIPDEHTRVYAEGIAIQLVIDRSGSMLGLDFEKDNKPISRLTAVKEVVEQFIAGGEELPGRPNDLIGLITFATYPDSVCPLTLDHGHLVNSVRQVEVSEDDRNRATAIGDAIALGVERIRGLDRRTDLLQQQRIKSRIMILLTDGENTHGDIEPITAARMAETFDIRIYTIGAATERTLVPIPDVNPFTGQRVIRQARLNFDEATLKQIAEITGGEYFRATDSESLREIYGLIDELERTEVQQRRYLDYLELAVQPLELNGVSMPPLLVFVLVLLAMEATLASTRFRRIP